MPFNRLSQPIKGNRGSLGARGGHARAVGCDCSVVMLTFYLDIFSVPAHMENCSVSRPDAQTPDACTCTDLQWDEYVPGLCPLPNEMSTSLVKGV